MEMCSSPFLISLKPEKQSVIVEIVIVGNFFNERWWCDERNEPNHEYDSNSRWEKDLRNMENAWKKSVGSFYSGDRSFLIIEQIHRREVQGF